MCHNIYFLFFLKKSETRTQTKKQKKLTKKRDKQKKPKKKRKNKRLLLRTVSAENLTRHVRICCQDDFRLATLFVGIEELTFFSQTIKGRTLCFSKKKGAVTLVLKV